MITGSEALLGDVGRAYVACGIKIAAPLWSCRHRHLSAEKMGAFITKCCLLIHADNADQLLYLKVEQRGEPG